MWESMGMVKRLDSHEASMNRLRNTAQNFAALVIFACTIIAFPLDWARASGPQSGSEGAQVDRHNDPGLVIETDSQLPDGYPHRHYELHLHARGGTAALHWKLEKGALPPGMQLSDEGVLLGEPTRAGEFQFTASVAEGGRPESAVQKTFVLKVVAALVLKWKNPAHVAGNRIEGSATITNTTPDDMDLTFIVLAVAENGRATAIGYQHYLLRSGTVAMELPFGDTLPSGGYVVHVDAVGEVESRDLIYRRRMQTPRALQVTVGP